MWYFENCSHISCPHYIWWEDSSISRPRCGRRGQSCPPLLRWRSGAWSWSSALETATAPGHRHQSPVSCSPRASRSLGPPVQHQTHAWTLALSKCDLPAKEIVMVRWQATNFSMITSINTWSPSLPFFEALGLGLDILNSLVVSTEFYLHCSHWSPHINVNWCLLHPYQSVKSITAMSVSLFYSFVEAESHYLCFCSLIACLDWTNYGE